MKINRHVTSTVTLLAAVTLLFGNVQAQDDVLEEVTVTAIRKAIQDQISLKRDSIEIVDGLNADEIGDLPALSIGEALETITAAASHRENGGASEISVRGMGPFLGTTVVNGREATNGAGNRAVNFSIFPAEMFNKVAIHKTQSASHVEGAVSGQIHLDTRRPIEYGDQRIQFSIKGAMHPDDGDINGQDEFGYRATGSYTNSWDTNMGVIGLAVGAQIRDESNPEQEATTTSGGGRFEACHLDSFDRAAQPLDTSGRCHDGSNGVTNDDIAGIIAADPNVNSVADIPWAYIPRDRQYRQNTTDDESHAFFGALQWQPSERLDIMLDVQISERDQLEYRQDLAFGATQNNIRNLVSNPRTGLIESFTTETDIWNRVTDFQRLEKYEGGGLNVGWQVADTLHVSFDVSIAQTERTETDSEIRMGTTEVLVTDPADIGSREDFLVDFITNAPGTDNLWLATIKCTDANGPDGDCDPTSLGTFDVTDPRYFSARDRLRLRARQQIREHEIEAYRSDLTWDTSDRLGFIYEVLGGIRYATMEYRTFGGNRGRAGINLFEDEDLDGVPGGSSNTAEARQIVFNAANNCGATGHPQSDFLSRSSGGRNLLTFANGIGNGSNWATFDHDCLVKEITANYPNGVQLQNGIETGSIDLAEDTLALYLQANYESELGGRSVRGNFGIRVVETDVTSIGYRFPLSVSQGTNSAGDPEFFITQDSSAGTPTETVVATNSYTEILPSATFIMDLDDDWVMRLGAYRGVSRPDPHSYGYNRDINTSDDTTQGNGFASLEDAVTGIGGGGNPFLESLPSWNFDFAVEWYVNDDTILAAGVYWKQFQGAFERVLQSEEYLIDGNTVTGSFIGTQVSDDKSQLHGLEITASHAFDYLPGILAGFGVKFSYNYADTDFEFEDGFGGDGVSIDSAGNVTQLIGIVAPGELWGLSRHTSSSQLYWQNDRLSFHLLYKTRSRYFQGYGRDTTARLRYTDSNENMEFRANYDVTDNITVSFEALNILSEPRVDYRAVIGNANQTLEYGPRMFLGLRAKF